MLNCCHRFVSAYTSIHTILMFITFNHTFCINFTIYQFNSHFGQWWLWEKKICKRTSVLCTSIRHFLFLNVHSSLHIFIMKRVTRITASDKICDVNRHIVMCNQSTYWFDSFFISLGTGWRKKNIILCSWITDA